MTDALSLAFRLAGVLEAAGVPYAIGGALAYGLWGDPRGTHDVDINLFVNGDGLNRALDAMCALGLVIDRKAASAADQRGDVIIGWLDGTRIDLFTPSIPFSWEAGNTRVMVEGPLGRASFLSAEATAIFKLLFFRPKDLVDVEKLVAVQGSDLDRPYIRRWLVEMMGEDDERVRAWDAIILRSAQPL